MEETRMGNTLTPDTQALMLLDHPDSKAIRQKLDLFLSPDFFIASSFASSQKTETPPNLRTSAQALSVAARLSSHRYEERAKSDALFNALKTLQQRNRSFGSGKVIRSK